MIEFYKQNLRGKSKFELAAIGKELAIEFCNHNRIYAPAITILDTKPRIARACGIFEGGNKIAIWPNTCAYIAFNPGDRKWSYPGYKVDREPIGVVAHEVGHYVDSIYKLYKNFPKHMEKITSYEPNIYEAVAESMKLFITNPHLLKIIAPTRFAHIIAAGLKPLIKDKWFDVLTSESHRNVIIKNFAT